ncbi:DUF262 domain-containing protein [Hymenobacter ruber]
MRTSATNRRLRVLITSIKDRTLIPRPDFQRRLVWSMKHKVAFIETVLENFPFPEIYVAAGEVNLETGMSFELLVDGQQRLDTVFQYFNGSETLVLPKTVKPYKDLSIEEKNLFLDYEVVVRDLGNIPIEEVKEIFQRINSTNYALNPMEVHNSQFHGELITFAEKISSLMFWEEHRVFSSNEVRRMLDMQFMLSLTVTIMSTYFNRNAQIEPYLEKYNDTFPDKDRINRELQVVLDKIDSLNIPGNIRVWKQSDIFTLIIELHKIMYKQNLDIESSIASALLIDFYKHVDNFNNINANSLDGFPLSYEEVANYRKAAIHATTDRNNRITRGEIINKLLMSQTQQRPAAKLTLF